MACGARKKYCDDEFGKCLRHTCKSRSDARECKEMANMFVLGVNMFGCNGYMSYQKDSCDCLHPEDAQRRVREYANDFYSAYNKTHALPEAILNTYFDDNQMSSSHNRMHEKHGELLFRLYKRYPHSIDVISRDGQAHRNHLKFFDVHTHVEL